MAKTIHVDVRPESYRSFFDHEWASSILAEAKGTDIESAAFDLTVAWRGVANTHVLPWMMLEQLTAFADGLTNASDPIGRRWISAVAERLPKEMGNSLRKTQRHRMQTVLDQLYKQVVDGLEKSTYSFPAEDTWRFYLSVPEFQISLWGSQRICYGVLYYAYEDFLLRCFIAMTGDSSYRISDQTFSKDFASSFSEELRDLCWSHSDVVTARLVRHALVHNGGRITPKLEKHRHKIHVENEELQIMAPDTSSLFYCLKSRALRLVAHVAQTTGTTVD